MGWHNRTFEVLSAGYHGRGRSALLGGRVLLTDAGYPAIATAAKSHLD